MQQPQKEPTPLNPSQAGKLCLKCGFPNRNGDEHCMYCRANLQEKDGLFTWIKQTFYVLLWRLELKQKNDGVKRRIFDFSPLKSSCYFVLGGGLTVTGIFLFIEAANSRSFSNAIISVLLLLYGFFTMKASITR